MNIEQLLKSKNNNNLDLKNICLALDILEIEYFYISIDDDNHFIHIEDYDRFAKILIKYNIEVDLDYDTYFVNKFNYCGDATHYEKLINNK